jgi:tape measure domain-containing protein
MHRGLTAVYGSAEIAARQIEFLRKSSSDSGVAFGQLTGEFVKFSASMKSANIPLEQSNALFKAVTAASAALGLGSEATAGALNALGQMASKGTVSMEELRQQLGDRLPGAMGLTAKGLGITEAQLVKLVESGQLATRDFIAPFTAALNTMKGEVDGIVPSWDRFKGLLSETAQGAGDAGWTQVLNLAIKVLGGTVGIFVLGLSGLSEALFLVIKGMAAMAVAFTSPKAALELMTDAVEQSRVRLTAQAVALNNLIAPAEAAASAATKHAAAMTESTAAAVKAISANTELSGAQRLAALSAVLAGDATLDAAAKIVQYNVAAAELLVKQQAQTDAYEKAAKAAKQHGDTLVELAKLTGNTTEIQNASTEAAQSHADALAKVAASQSTETAILVGQKAELLASQAARGLTTEQIKVQADALDKLIIKSRAETDQAAQASLAAQQTLLERKLATEALKDNSVKLAEYETALDEAKKSLELNVNLEKLGLTTKAEVTAAQQDVSVATYRYRDALNDVIAKLRLDTQAKSANLLVAEAQAAARQSHYDALAREARALGDSTLATHYDIAAKQEAIQVLKLKMDLERLQNAAALVELETKRKLIDSTSDEGKAKLRAIDIEVALLKVKNTHNEAIKDQIRLIESEVTALRNGTASTGSNTSARTTNAQAIAAQTSEIDKQTAALARERAEMRALGEAMTEVYNSPAAVLSRKRAAGTLTAADLSSAQTNFDVANNNLNQVQTGPAGFMSPEAIAAREREYRDAKAILERTKSLTDGTGGSTQSGSEAAGSTAPGTTGSTTTVNINLGGRTTTVRVASQADANNLTSLLRQIEAAAGVST